MAHELDLTNNRANMAYKGEAPWHGLGQELTYDASIDTWKKEAGLNFTVKRAKVSYAPEEGGSPLQMKGRDVLFRDDDRAPLGIVSDGYKIVQPGEVLEFFRNLTENSGFQMETAGSLHGGKRIWALAKMNEGYDVVGVDRVMPYLLLATSFDGGLATTAKFTAIRVVCHNTITVALQTAGTGEHQVKVAHHSTFDATAVQKQLGVFKSAWDNFMTKTARLAAYGVDEKAFDRLTLELVASTLGPKADGTKQDEAGVRDSKAYRRLLELFNGDAIGSKLGGGQSGWQWLNSVTQYIDHEKGRTPDSRMNSAWFGGGDTVKTRALDLVTAAMETGL